MKVSKKTDSKHAFTFSRFASSLLLYTLLDPASAMAAAGTSSASLVLPQYVNGTCIVDPHDSFEPNIKMGSGPLKGFCIDPQKRRSVQILSDSQAASYFKPEPGYIVVANFSHQQKFWVARIPIQKATRMLLQVEYFPMYPVKFIQIAHTQFRIDFDSQTPIEMVSQSRKPNEPQQKIQLKRLIFSVENIGPYGEPFDALKGTKDHYRLAYRLVSVNDKYKWMIQEQNHQVKQFLLKMNPQQVQDFLKRALQEGNTWSTRKVYHTLKSNCVTELFVLLDEVLGIQNEVYPQIPNFAISSLQRRGLIDSTSHYPTLNEEYPSLD